MNTAPSELPRVKATRPGPTPEAYTLGRYLKETFLPLGVFSVLFATLGLLVGSFGALDVVLRAMGEEVQAVVSHQEVHGRNSVGQDAQYYTYYSFTLAGQSYSGSHNSNSNALYSRSDVGEAIAVRYLSFDPTKNGIPDSLLLPVLTFLFASVFLGLALLMVKSILTCGLHVLRGTSPVSPATLP